MRNFYYIKEKYEDIFNIRYYYSVQSSTISVQLIEYVNLHYLQFVNQNYRWYYLQQSLFRLNYSFSQLGLVEYNPSLTFVHRFSIMAFSQKEFTERTIMLVTPLHSIYIFP